jgi:hypothetical protein
VTFYEDDLNDGRGPIEVIKNLGNEAIDRLQPPTQPSYGDPWATTPPRKPNFDNEPPFR